ncbi:MAG: ankyrin repeat domain-containing protein [Alphaproteobacteria bacterium]|nr:MAG: ankyrin repeat domain-containing protein [Alphaproteobacteria bacterium]
MSLTQSDLFALDKGGELLDAMKESNPNRRHIMACIGDNYPIDQLDDAGNNVLSVAAFRGFAPETAALLKRGAWVGHADKNGCTPLICAALMGHLDVVKLLVAAKADVHAVDAQNRTAAYGAMKNGFTDVTAFLIESGAVPPPVDLDVELKTAVAVSRPLRLKR